MKKILCFLLILAALFSAGCSSQQPQPTGTPFYYCAATPDYSSGSTAIIQEYRDDVPSDSLMAALELYLAGPQSGDLLSPFPDGMQILSATQEGNTVYLTVSMELTTLTGLELTIACGCLTMTSLALTDAQQVQISPIYGLLDGQRTIIMNKNTILLTDSSKN